MKTKLPGIRYTGFGLLNIIFWVAVYFFYTYFLGYGSSNTDYVNLFSIFLMPVSLLVSYVLVFYLVPNYLLAKKYVLFIVYTIYTLVISFAGILISIFYGLVFSSYLKDVSTSVLTKSLPLIILSVYFVIAVAVMLNLLYYNYAANLKNEDLKNKFLESQLQLKNQELKFLKMQIHPHFLFNSLNTLYGLSLQGRDETPEMILKLSNLLDYILYQTQKPVVLLKDELKHIQDYIDLEQRRFPDALEVEFAKKLDDDKLKLPPMLFLPFVENAFKHGVKLNGKLQVKITVELKKNNLNFFIENSATEQHQQNTGIGLENIQKRLELLYPKMYNLEAKLINKHYTVHLHIITQDQ